MTPLPGWTIVAEGCIDRFCGRPLDQNPYCRTHARGYAEAWEWGWREADYLLDLRGAEETRRWLQEAA